MKELLDVLLIAAPSPSPLAVISNRVTSYPPLGICSIATYLENYNYIAEICDLQLEHININTITNIINTKKPSLIGISTTTESYQCGLRIARICKEIDDSMIIVIGGAHVTFEYKDALKNKFVDIVSLREGEETIKELCDFYIGKNIPSLSEIKGIVYRDGNEIIKTKNRSFIKNLDGIPFPNRKFVEINKYKTPGTISSSRGCPGKCIFCAAGAMGGGKYRCRSAQSVVNEMDYLSKLGINYFHFIDDTVTADMERLELLISELTKKKNRDKNFQWACESRVDIVTKDLMKWLKKSGCISVQFGVESGSQTMLDSMKKEISLEQIREAFSLASEAGIQTSCCFIIGNPEDTRTTTEESIAFAEELSAMGAYIVYSISTPYPGTFMFNNADKLGLEIFDRNWDHYTTYTSVMNTKHLSSQEIQSYFFDASTSKSINNSEAHRKRTEYIRKSIFKVKGD